MILLLIFLIGCTHACTPCSCNLPYTLTCVEVDMFPNISRFTRESISYIDLVNTQLYKLPHFNHYEWPRLEFLTLINNTRLQCPKPTYYYVDCVPTETKKGVRYTRVSIAIVCIACIVSIACFLSCVSTLKKHQKKYKIQNHTRECELSSGQA